ncbi:MAG: dihydrolipoyl dehydrogenase [Spirochaetales bacterium]|nr:dihydrolipoyl dehydrogenase [Spirochaetales bacterium]
MAEKYDLLIIGSGPAGYVAGIRAAQLGMRAVIVEKGKVGGVCLNIGCIPSKALIHQAELFLSLGESEKTGVKIDRSAFDYTTVFSSSRKAADDLSKGVRFLLKKNNITLVEAEGKVVGPHDVALSTGETLQAEHLLLATGSTPREIPGFSFDGKDILSSDDALMLEKLPKSLLILGGGAIGCEFAHIMNAFGVQVTVVEMMDHLLPAEDADTAAILERSFKKRKITVKTGTTAGGYRREKGSLVVQLEDRNGKKEETEAEKILVVVGRKALGDRLGLESVGITVEKGAVPVGDYYQTAVPSIYAVGDVIAGPQLAHLASKEAEIAVEHMAGRSPEPKADPMLVPRAVYTEPQVAGFGMTEKEAKEKGLPAAVSVFPYRGAGKSVAVGKTEGQVKIIYRSDTKEILGAGLAGAQATELLHELLLAKKAELLPEDLATMIHAHPTLSETLMEAARGVEGWMIHA